MKNWHLSLCFFLTTLSSVSSAVEPVASQTPVSSGSNQSEGRLLPESWRKPNSQTEIWIDPFQGWSIDVGGQYTWMQFTNPGHPNFTGNTGGGHGSITYQKNDAVFAQLRAVYNIGNLSNSERNARERELYTDLLAGYCFSYHHDWMFTPYAGIGFDFLSDHQYSTPVFSGNVLKYRLNYGIAGLEARRRFGCDWVLGGQVELFPTFSQNETLQSSPEPAWKLSERLGVAARLPIDFRLYSTSWLEVAPYYRFFPIGSSNVVDTPRRNLNEAGVLVTLRFFTNEYSLAPSSQTEKHRIGRASSPFASKNSTEEEVKSIRCVVVPGCNEETHPFDAYEETVPSLDDHCDASPLQGWSVDLGGQWTWMRFTTSLQPKFIGNGGGVHGSLTYQKSDSFYAQVRCTYNRDRLTMRGRSCNEREIYADLLAGYCFAANENWLFTPYLGAGVEFLNDYKASTPTIASLGLKYRLNYGIGGLEIRRLCGKDWALGGQAEFFPTFIQNVTLDNSLEPAWKLGERIGWAVRLPIDYRLFGATWLEAAPFYRFMPIGSSNILDMHRRNLNEAGLIVTFRFFL